jgi:hypothetical protein
MYLWYVYEGKAVAGQMVAANRGLMQGLFEVGLVHKLLQQPRLRSEYAIIL